jgi:hypothetical protein
MPKKKQTRIESTRSALPDSSLAPESLIDQATIWSVDSTSTLYDAAACASAQNLTQEEWDLVVKSRRTHVHSRLALERLSSLLIGELEPIEIPGIPSGGDLMMYSNMEYRRYAIVGKTLITEGDAIPVYKVKFSLLYPYGMSLGRSYCFYLDVRVGQPVAFQIGDSVEIQVQVDDNVVSRNYTPISGDLSSFEVIIKEKKVFDIPYS